LFAHGQVPDEAGHFKFSLSNCHHELELSHDIGPPGAAACMLPDTQPLLFVTVIVVDPQPLQTPSVVLWLIAIVSSPRWCHAPAGVVSEFTIYHGPVSLADCGAHNNVGVDQ
jgi:hypothetical protein